jgi:cytochrome c5
MQGTNIRTSLLFFLCALLLLSCGEAGSKKEHPVAAIAPDLKEVTTKLPQASGYQTYINNCTICHSASYVQNQPALPQKTWTAIVTKMQKTFGAPVSDSSAQVIIQYLTTIKGKRQS